MNSFQLAAAGGLIVGLFTVSGAFLGLFGQKAKRGRALLSLDFALGMMIAAAGLAMIAPSASQVWHSGSVGQEIVFLISLIFGWVLIQGFGQMLEKRNPGNRVWLFVVAICLHNIPEGMAAGIGLSELGLTQSLSLIGLIGVQNIPEGLICFLAFQGLGASHRMAFLAAAGTGIFEFAGGIAAGGALQFFQGITPLLLGFAGSAMLTVSFREVRERLKEKNLVRIWQPLASGFGFMALLQLATT